MKILKTLGKIGTCLLLYAITTQLIWNYSGIRKRLQIRAGDEHVFQVVVITPQGAQLFLHREEHDEFLKTQQTYTYLIPVGQEKQIQKQILTSYEEKYHDDDVPILRVKQLDAQRQEIELYLSGDPTDRTLWYEATDKSFVPKQQMIFGAFDWLPYGVLSIGLVFLEYKGIMWLVQRWGKQKMTLNTENIT